MLLFKSFTKTLLLFENYNNSFNFVFRLQMDIAPIMSYNLVLVFKTYIDFIKVSWNEKSKFILKVSH